MMRALAQELLARMGYRIARCSTASATDPFAEMKRLSRQVMAPTVFDVGAHHGETVRIFRQTFPTARIHAFEPVPDSYRVLQQAVLSDPLTRALNLGFSDTKGPQPFHCNLFSATNSLLATDPRGAGTWGPGLLETVRTVSAQFTTLDDFVESMGIEMIDILKLDVQGAEYRVLRGAEKTIAASRMRLVYSEIITLPTYEGQRQLHEVLTLLHDYGFALHNIYNLSVASGGQLRQVDAIFTLRSQAHESATPEGGA